jgi:integrase
MKVSNPKLRRSLKRGHNTLRPPTYDNDEEIFELYLLPAFGSMLIRDIDIDAVYAWLISQADRGFACSTVLGHLIHLRAVVGAAKAGERPEEFPWKGCLPIDPDKPLRPANDPKKWGGQPGSTEPLLPLSDVNRLGIGFQAAFQSAIYIEALAGTRIGEAFGLQIGDFEWIDGVLWVQLERQMNDKNVIVPWVKTDAGYRKIPLAAILANYLIEYCSLYHGCDLMHPDPEFKGRQLIVNPAGRDVDGSFLTARRTNFASKVSKVRVTVGLSHERLGYWVDSGHLRKGLSTYALHGEEIVRAIDKLEQGVEPSDTDELIAHLRAKLSVAAEPLVVYSDMDVSRYLGHAYDGKGDPLAASAVTLRYYNLTVNSNAAFLSIAETIDKIARHEIGELFVDTDVLDSLPVHFSDDEEWMTSDVAGPLVGLTQGNISVAVNEGRLVGHLGWLANGGYKRNANSGRSTPAKPRMFVSRTSVKEMARIKAMPSVKDLARRIGMSSEAVTRNFIDTGHLRTEVTKSAIRVDPDDAARLLSDLHGAVLDCFDPGRSMTVRDLTRHFNARHGSLFVERRALPRWIQRWVDDLIANGRLRLRQDKLGLTQL